MIHKIVAVRDRALDAYLRLFTAPSLGVAIRSFQDEMNRPDSEMSKHPDDYDLHHIGDFDDNTGQIKPNTPPQQIAIGKNVIATKQ